MSWRPRELPPSEATASLSTVPHPSHKLFKSWPASDLGSVAPPYHDHVAVRTMHPDKGEGRRVLIELAIARPDRPWKEGDPTPTSWVESRVYLTAAQAGELAVALGEARSVAFKATAKKTIRRSEVK